MTIKMILDDRDGEPFLYEGRQEWMDDEDWAWYQSQVVEIPVDVHTRYQAFLDESMWWFMFFKKLKKELNKGSNNV